MKKQTGFFTNFNGPIVALVGICLFAFVAIGGWVANIVKLIGMIDGDVTAMFIGRIVGVFAAPVGAVLGYF